MTTSNEIYSRALRSLTKNRDELKAMTERYPVICEFGEHRRMLEKPSDVDDLISQLANAIETSTRLPVPR